MKVVLCIKQVLDTNIPLTLDPKGNGIEPDDIVYIVNPADRHAVEEAVKIKEKVGEAEITLLTLGPKRARAALLWGLAMGADKAVHLWDRAFEKIDPLLTSVIFSRAIEQMEYDLILCGSRAADDSMASVGPGIAEQLNIAHASSIAQLEIDPRARKATAYRCLEKGDREVLECSLPALFTIEPGFNEPRYPSLTACLLAREKEILELDASALGLWGSSLNPLTKIKGLSYPRPRPKKIFTPPSHLPASERLKLIMSGGLTQKKDSQLVEEAPEAGASKLLEFLKAQKIEF